MASDRLFAQEKARVGDFAFDRSTVLVFDDIRSPSSLRSTPLRTC